MKLLAVYLAVFAYSGLSWAQKPPSPPPDDFPKPHAPEGRKKAKGQKAVPTESDRKGVKPTPPVTPPSPEPTPQPESEP